MAYLLSLDIYATIELICNLWSMAKLTVYIYIIYISQLHVPEILFMELALLRNEYSGVIFRSIPQLSTRFFLRDISIFPALALHALVSFRDPHVRPPERGSGIFRRISWHC